MFIYLPWVDPRMALKSTSSPIAISQSFQQGVANTFEVIPVDLQLNPLDQEVFVVTAVKIDFENLPRATAAPGVLVQAEFEISVCKSRPAAMQGIGSSNVVAAASIDTETAFDGAGNPLSVAILEQNAMDAPPSQMEYLDIIATDNFFIAVDGNATQVPVLGQLRVYGYRAKADAATYAALVQSEMLSS